MVGTNYYALVNQTEHPLNKLSPHYTPVQLELFKRIVEEVVTSETGTVTSIQVLNFEFDETGEFMVYFEYAMWTRACVIWTIWFITLL